jgi:hypothetical protein
MSPEITPTVTLTITDEQLEFIAWLLCEVDLGVWVEDFVEGDTELAKRLESGFDLIGRAEDERRQRAEHDSARVHR